MDALFPSETFVAKRINEWDRLFTRLSTYTDTKEYVYTRKQNVQFTSMKHGFRKRFSNRKNRSRPRKLAFEVQDLDNDEYDTEVLSDDSSIYSANDELESNIISDSESVNSVQYVLQCNEQRKLPDFNTKVENCQTYMLQNACFNQGVNEKNPYGLIDNSSANKKTLQCDEICSKNPVENEQILTTAQSHISHSANKPLKSILSTKQSEKSSRSNKKITFSSEPDSEIEIEEFQSDDDISDNETDQHTSQNTNLSTTENTNKTLSTNNITVNNGVNVNQLNMHNVNNLEKAIYSLKTNEKPKIYSSAARNKRQLSVNSENTVDQISEIKITTINTSLNEVIYNSSKETYVNNEPVTELIENESLIEINQCNEQNVVLKTDVIRKTPSKHKQTVKNKCRIVYSTELDNSDNESLILNTNLSETIVRNEDSVKKQITRSYLISSSSESDSELCVNHTNIDLKSNNFAKRKNTIRQEDSKNITNKENQIVYKLVDSIKSNSQETPRITSVKTINPMCKLKNATPKDNCKKSFTNTTLKETSTDNSEEEHDKENSLPKANSTRIKRKELNKNKETRKMSKKIGMKVFSTEKQYLLSSTPNVNADRQKSSREECFKEYNDEITELFSCDQSMIINQEQIQKNVDENSSEDDEIFETIKNINPGNQQVKSNMSNIIDKNTVLNDNFDDMTDTIVHLRSTRNEQTDSKSTGILDISSSNEVVKPNTLIKSSRKKKLRENIRDSPTLATKSNTTNQSSKFIKCRQRLFNSSSENDNDNCVVQFNSTVLSVEIKQDELNMGRENLEDLNKDNQTHSLAVTVDVISKFQKMSVNEQNSILENHKKRKIGDSNCGPVKQMEKKYKQQQITLENNIKQINKHNYNKTVESIKDKSNTNRKLSEKQNGKKRRTKCKKEIRFITYSTDECTNGEDKIWSISSIKNRTPLSLEYFFDDDVF